MKMSLFAVAVAADQIAGELPNAALDAAGADADREVAVGVALRAVGCDRTTGAWSRR